MPDILIRNFKMPKDHSLWLVIRPDGTVFKIKDNDKSGAPKEGTAIFLPEGHGRLGDLDALFEKMYHLSDNEGVHKDSAVDDALILRDSACYLIEDAPTIIEAEGGNADG